jgi:glycosyltransferase involved in cell wall biosynthesis
MEKKINQFDSSEINKFDSREINQFDSSEISICIINIFQGKARRGAETFVDELSRRLELKYEVKIISGNRRLPQRWPLVWRLHIDPYGLSIFWFTIKNLPKIYGQKYDVVIAINGGWQPLILRLATWIYGGKLVLSGQSGIGWDERCNLYSFPDYFVALSSKAQRWARKFNPFVKVKYVPNGVDLDKFKPEGEKMDLGLKRPVILVVAALTKAKQIDLTIKAVARLANTSLVVVGEGEMKEDVDKLGKNLLDGRFKLISLKHSQMPKIYRSADLFTLVSHSREAFGIAYVEAMASNLPIVSVDDEQRREIVGNAGLFVKNPEDSEEYARMIDKAISIKWDNKPRKASKKFSWDEIALEYENIINELKK